MDPHFDLPLPSEVDAALMLSGEADYHLDLPEIERETDMEIGINVGWFGAAGHVDSVPFVNQMKGAKPWWIWNGDQVEYDANGYPTAFDDSTRLISTILDRTPSLDGVAPFTGTFRLYGEGSGRFWIGQEQTRLVDPVWTDDLPTETVGGETKWYLDIDYTAAAGSVQMKLMHTTPGDHIQDLALVHHSHLDAHRSGEIYGPEFLDDLAGYDILRFMEWGEAIRYDETGADPDQSASEQRYIGPDHFTFNTRAGDADTDNVFISSAPIAHIVGLANATQADAWINLAVDVTDDRASALAAYVAETLDPGLDVYWEYGNEMWAQTPGFEGYGYAEARGAALFGLQGDAAVSEWAAYRGAALHDIIDDAFAQDPDRVHYVGPVFSYDPPNVGTWENTDSYSRTYFDGSGGSVEVAGLDVAGWQTLSPDWSLAGDTWTSTGAGTLVLETQRVLDDATPYTLTVTSDTAAQGELRLRAFAAGGGSDLLIDTAWTLSGAQEQVLEVGPLPTQRDMLRLSLQWIGDTPLEVSLSGVTETAGSGPMDHVTHYTSSLYAGVTDNAVTAHVTESYDNDSTRAAALARWALFGLDDETTYDLTATALSAPAEAVAYVPGMSISVARLVHDDIRAGLDTLNDLDTVMRLNGNDLQYRGVLSDDWTTVLSFVDAPEKGLDGLMSDVELIGHGFWGFGSFNSGIQKSLANQSWIRLDGHDDFVSGQGLDWAIYEGNIVLPDAGGMFEAFEKQGWRAHLLAAWLAEAERFGVDQYIHYTSHNRTATNDTWGLRDFAGQADTEAPTAAFLERLLTYDETTILPPEIARFDEAGWMQSGNWILDGSGQAVENQERIDPLVTSVSVTPGSRNQLTLKVGADTADPGDLRIVVQAVGGGADRIGLWDQAVTDGQTMTVLLDEVPMDRDQLRITLRRGGETSGALRLSDLDIVALPG